MVCHSQEPGAGPFGGAGVPSSNSTLRSRLFAAREAELQNGGGANGILPFRRAWEELLASASGLPIPASALQALANRELPRQQPPSDPTPATASDQPQEPSTVDEQGRSRWRPGGIGLLVERDTGASPVQSRPNGQQPSRDRVIATIQSQMDSLRRISLGNALAASQAQPEISHDNDVSVDDDVPTFHFQTDQTTTESPPPAIEHRQQSHRVSRLIRILANRTAASPRSQAQLQSSDTVVVSFPERSDNPARPLIVSPRILRLPSSSNPNQSTDREPSSNNNNSNGGDARSMSARSFMDMWAETQANRRMMLRQTRPRQDPPRTESLDSDMEIDGNNSNDVSEFTAARTRPVVVGDGTSRRSVRLLPRSNTDSPTQINPSHQIGASPEFRLMRMRDMMNARRILETDDYSSDVPRRRQRRHPIINGNTESSQASSEDLNVPASQLSTLRDPDVVRRLVRLVVDGDEVETASVFPNNERPFC